MHSCTAALFTVQIFLVFQRNLNADGDGDEKQSVKVSRPLNKQNSVFLPLGNKSSQFLSI